MTGCHRQTDSDRPASSESQSDLSSAAEEVPSTISIDGVEFYPIEVSQTLLNSLDNTEGVGPGERAQTVSEIKTALYNSAELEFVAYSQMRPEVADLFDDHLETLISTLYDFCQLEREVTLDELTIRLLQALPTLPETMQQDIYSVYKGRMIEAGIDGTLLRSGESLGLYYMAQNDPDWADYPFPNASSPNEADDTAADRACGVMSMTMVASTYLHREVDPTQLMDYVLENGYRITASGVDDTFMSVAADLFGLEAPEIYYRDPAEGQQALDWDYVADYIANNNALGIVHDTRGNFTPAQHYMVLNDYVEINGTGYFLVSDSYRGRNRYDMWGTSAMADPESGEEGVVYATPELLASTSSAVILFQADQDAWEISCSSSSPAQIS